MRFPTFWFEPTPQGKFMLNIAFGQSKYYVDSLAENTRRGLVHKAQQGEYPGRHPSATSIIGRRSSWQSIRKEQKLLSRFSSDTPRATCNLKTCLISSRSGVSFQEARSRFTSTTFVYPRQSLLLRHVSLCQRAIRRKTPATYLKSPFRQGAGSHA